MGFSPSLLSLSPSLLSMTLSHTSIMDSTLDNELFGDFEQLGELLDFSLTEMDSTDLPMTETDSAIDLSFSTPPTAPNNMQDWEASLANTFQFNTPVVDEQPLPNHMDDIKQ